MSVVIETTLGDITVDLYTKKRPRACLNFLKLCKVKYYNYNLFHTVTRGFVAQTGDPTGSRTGGESIFGVVEGPLKRYFEAETNPRIKHTIMGLISFVGNDENMLGSQFFFTLGNDLTYLDERHCVFGEVVEGLDVLEIMNEAICDTTDRPYQDIRITHTVVLDDPFPDVENIRVPSRSPSPSAQRLQGGRIAPDEEIDETAGKTVAQVYEMTAEREAKARATILEMVGDIPDAEMAPPENVLFVCKLNPVTSDDDLEIIFSRFGKVKSCEVIRDKKSGDSLQYAFVEFHDQKSCEDAYFKMDNVLIDDRRIHVDFSQSVSKVKWLGKGRGVKQYGAQNKDLASGKYTKNYKSDRNRSDERNKREQHVEQRHREENMRYNMNVSEPRYKDYKNQKHRYDQREKYSSSTSRRNDDKHLKRHEKPHKRSRSRSKDSDYNREKLNKQKKKKPKKRKQASSESDSEQANKKKKKSKKKKRRSSESSS